MKAGGFDPLFSLNHTCAMFRDNTKCLSRKLCSVGMDMLRDHPNSFAWTDTGDFLLEINPGQMPPKEWQTVALDQLKYNETGLSLVGWYIHPNLLKDTPFDKYYIHKNSTQMLSVPDYTKKRFTEVENYNGAPRYLVTLLDLTEKDIPYLEKAKTLAINKLKNTYKVDPSKDKVNLYFHFPYAGDTAGLHLHVRVNQGVHAVEQAKSFSFDDVINGLKARKGIEEIILERQAQDQLNDEAAKCIYANSGAESTLENLKVPGVSYRTVDNHLQMN